MRGDVAAQPACDQGHIMPRAPLALLLLGLFSGSALAAAAAPLDELDQASEKHYDAWNRIALTERKVTFVAEKAQGYGMYQDRQSSIFKPGEKIITYVEPIGYRWKTLPGAMYEMNFLVDVLIKDADGNVIGDKKGFLKNISQSHNAGMEFFMNLTLTLEGVPAGSYVVTYTLHDISGGQTSSFDQEFNISGD